MDASWQEENYDAMPEDFGDKSTTDVFFDQASLTIAPNTSDQFKSPSRKAVTTEVKQRNIQKKLKNEIEKLNSGTDLIGKDFESFEVAPLDKMAKFQTAMNPKRRDNSMPKQSNSELSKRQTAQRLDQSSKRNFNRNGLNKTAMASEQNSK